MWVAEIKIDGSKSLLGSRAKKYNVSLVGYPMHTYERKDFLSVSLIGMIFGEEKNKKKFCDSIRRSDRTISMENKKDVIITIIKESLMYRAIHDRRIIRVKPIIIKNDSTEIWTIGSFKREILRNFIEKYEKTHNGKLIKIKKENVENFRMFGFLPKITEKQKQTLEVALKHNYYNYPRKVSLKKLAKECNISYSTYQAHLRKAERAIIPFFFGALSSD
jgi:predicted DNA binding protein